MRVFARRTKGSSADYPARCDQQACTTRSSRGSTQKFGRDHSSIAAHDREPGRSTASPSAKNRLQFGGADIVGPDSSCAGRHHKPGNNAAGNERDVFPDGLTIKAYQEAVFNALQPQTYSFKQETKDERTGKVDASAYALSVFADVSAITKPNEKKKWSGGYPASILRGAPSVCAGKGPKDSVNVELDGKPDGEALCS